MPLVLDANAKAIEFHRTYDSVVMLASLMGIPPEQ